MTKITKEAVEKIGKLAKIHITDKEKERFQKDLSGILGYVEKLNKINTDKVAETSQVTGLVNVWQEDEITDSWKADLDPEKNQEMLLANTKDKKDGFVKVKKMLN